MKSILRALRKQNDSIFTALPKPTSAALWRRDFVLRHSGWALLLPLVSMYDLASAQPTTNALIAAQPAAYAVAPPSDSQAEAVEQVFKPGQIVAMVGEEPILASELLNLIEPMLAEAKGRASEAQVLSARERLMRQALVSTVQTKMLSQVFIQRMVKNKPVAERKETRDQVRMQVNRVFYESYIPEMLKEKKVNNEVELDQLFRSQGTSLEGQKLTFLDSMLANEMMRDITPKNVNVDILAVRDQYEKEIEDWHRQPRARFQVMTILFRNFETKEAAYREIAGMYEEVRLGGASFESVAKKKSQGPRAEDGGLFDWTTEGSLRSEQLNEVVFSIPLNRLSNIFEDSDGFHFAVVVERDEARTIPFEDAHEEIRKRMAEEKKVKIRDDFIEKLKQTTQVWTAWPQDIPGSRPIAEITGTAGR